MSGILAGKRAYVTGGSSGIGAGSQQVFRPIAHGQKRWQQRMIDDALEFLDRCIEDRRTAASPGADQDSVKTAHGSDGRRRDALHVGRDGGVSRSEAGFAVRLQSFNGFAQDAFAPAGDENRSAFSGHRSRAGKTDPGSAPVDQCFLARQPVTQCLPLSVKSA